MRGEQLRALQLQDGLGESALRAGLTFAPSALAFGLCGFYWGRLPARVHQAIGVAVFGSVFLALAAHPAPHASGHALATTFYWLAALLAIATLAALPLARTTGKTAAA